MDTTLIIDGNNLVWRCFYVAESVNPGGMDGLLHVHMFLSSLKNYCELYKPKNVICCWDKRLDNAPNFRNSLLPEYKEQRDKDKAKDVHCENELIEELISYLGVVNFYPKQLEADDCIAWLCHNLPGKKVIVSVDKDMLQLVNDDVLYYDPMKKVEINMSNFDTYSKFKYDTFLVEKCFAGDPSDNVKGIYKFGPVKVKKYLDGDVELNDEQKTQLEFNMKLFKLDLYNTLPCEIEHYKKQDTSKKVNWDGFVTLCTDKGLNSILKSKESYYNEFCMDIKLANMFENLFG